MNKRQSKENEEEKHNEDQEAKIIKVSAVNNNKNYKQKIKLK